MITVTRLQGTETYLLNCDLIETVEATPDTVITLVTKRRMLVRESLTEVEEKIRTWRRSLLSTISPHNSDVATGAHAVLSIHDGEQAA